MNIQICDSLDSRDSLDTTIMYINNLRLRIEKLKEFRRNSIDVYGKDANMFYNITIYKKVNIATVVSFRYFKQERRLDIPEDLEFPIIKLVDSKIEELTKQLKEVLDKK